MNATRIMSSQLFVDGTSPLEPILADASRKVAAVDLDTMIRRVKFAARKLLNEDSYLLSVGNGGSSERSIVFHFARYLLPLFPTWNLDVEYNRDLERLKTRASEKRNVFPDVIIHKRGMQGSKGNLAILEAKKSTQSNSDISDDISRMLDIMRNPTISHRFGCYLLFHANSVDAAFWLGSESINPVFATGRLAVIVGQPSEPNS